MGKNAGQKQILKGVQWFWPPLDFYYFPFGALDAPGASSSCGSFCYLHTSSCVLWHVSLDFARKGSRSPLQRFMSLSSVCFSGWRVWVGCVCACHLNPILPRKLNISYQDVSIVLTIYILVWPRIELLPWVESILTTCSRFVCLSPV